LTHGLSNRLVGGQQLGNCLQTTQSAGLGEGWSDAIALLLQWKPEDIPTTSKVVGEYVANNPKGVRSVPFTTDMNVNSKTYSSLKKTNESHAQGEVWTAFLNEMYWGMVQMDGFVPVAQLKDSADSGKGNSNYLKLVINGMKTLKCNPTFIDARNGLITADQATFNGKYRCTLLKAFAKRGMGVNAKDDGNFNDNNDIPPECK
jgi:extracellular elastinolytic metalloproteinase